MPFRSYLKHLTASTSPSSSTYNVDACEVDDGPNDDVDALRWKLYGKNEEFRIMHDAAVTIQSFWRGCFSRAMTSTKIQTLIEDITAFRKLEAQYKKRDEEYQRKQQQPRMQEKSDPDEENGSDDDKQHNSGLTGNSRLARRNDKNKPWAVSTDDDDSDDRMATLVPSTRKLSEFREGEEEEEPWKTNRISGSSESVDDGSRGYRRYRTNIHAKNKTRPWRDDTNMFDAY